MEYQSLDKYNGIVSTLFVFFVHGFGTPLGFVVESLKRLDRLFVYLETPSFFTNNICFLYSNEQAYEICLYKAGSASLMR